MSLPEPAKEVLEKARDGDPGAFDSLVGTYYRLVFNFAWRMTFNRDDAAEIVQEVFLRLFRNFQKFNPEGRFGPWFMRLAVNVCINERRSRMRKAIPSLSGEEDACGPDTNLPQAGESLDRTESREIVLRAVEDLKPSYRAIVMLRYLKDLSYDEIAAILGLPEGTVKNRLFRAREVLRAKLERIGISR